MCCHRTSEGGSRGPPHDKNQHAHEYERDEAVVVAPNRLGGPD